MSDGIKDGRKPDIEFFVYFALQGRGEVLECGVEELGGGEGLAGFEGVELHIEHVVLDFCLDWMRTNEKKPVRSSLIIYPLINAHLEAGTSS